MTSVTLFFDGRRVTVTPPEGPDFHASITAKDLGRWQAWIAAYRADMRTGMRWDAKGAGAETAPATTGQDLFAWVDGLRTGWLTRALQACATLTWTLIVLPRPATRELAAVDLFLDLPWEHLTAPSTGALADDPTLDFGVVRRVGRPGPPAAPPDYRLGMVFMAAAPEDQEPLDFEAEEWAVLQAAEATGMDLIVEESGTLSGLAARLAECPAMPQVLHLSCHGTPGSLCFESEAAHGGRSQLVSAEDLHQNLPGGLPPLVFVSACAGADPGDAADGAHPTAFARALLGRNDVRAVVAWSGKVADRAATAFAAAFYRALCHRATPADALRRAQDALAMDPDLRSDRGRARLLLAPDGGGPLVGRGEALFPNLPQRQSKEFLDKQGERIPVAGSATFVGRRRELRRILALVREGQTPGVLVRGIGTVGKSSLANRVAHRLMDHRPVVLYGTWTAADLVDKLKQAYPEAPVWRTAVTDHFDGLTAALRGFLRDDAHGRAEAAPPLLLILDDFEQALQDPEPDQPATVRPEMAEPVAAVLRAFQDQTGRGRSFLIITSRLAFRLSWDGVDLGQVPVTVPLGPMSPTDRRKQWRAKTADTPPTSDAGAEKKDVDPDGRRVLDLAGGIPGLQDRLTRLRAALPAEAFAKLLDEVAAFWAGGDSMGEIEVFLAYVMLPRLIDWLGPEEHLILGAFRTAPVWLPRDLAREVLTDLGLETADGRRLTRLESLSLLDRVTASDGTPLLALAPLAAPRIRRPPRRDLKVLAAQVCDAAPRHWPHTDNLPDKEAWWLTRLALFCSRPLPPAPLPAKALNYLWIRQEIGRVGRLAARIFSRSGDTLAQADLKLLTNLARALARTGRLKAAELCFALGTRHVEHAGDPNPACALFLGAQAEYLIGTGRLGEAETAAASSRDMFQQLGPLYSRETAIAWGRLAEIHFQRGDLDEAFRIRREEELPVYERIGDVRSRAVAWGNIADILFQRGDLDEALRIRKEEQLPVFERIGDVHARAVTWGKIADILFQRGAFDEALRIRKVEELPVYERIGDVHSRAATWGDIADILFQRGDLDEALRIRKEEELPVYERIGDVHARAVTWGKIADILFRRGDLDEALRIRKEEQLPVYERIGDMRERALTWGNIADILFQRSDYDEELRIRMGEELPVYLALGDLRYIAICRTDIAVTYMKMDPVAHQHEIAGLLLDAAAGIRHMGIPESGQIRDIFAHFIMMVSEREKLPPETIRARFQPLDPAAE